MKKAFAPLKDALKRGDAESFKMFEELDDYTVRDYLTKKMRVVLQPAYRSVADRCLGILTTKPFSGWRRLTGKLLLGCVTYQLSQRSQRHWPVRIRLHRGSDGLDCL